MPAFSLPFLMSAMRPAFFPVMSYTVSSPVASSAMAISCIASVSFSFVMKVNEILPSSSFSILYTGLPISFEPSASALYSSAAGLLVSVRLSTTPLGASIG